MAQLHSYYITNSRKEICYPENFSENEIQDAIEATYTSFIDDNETGNEENEENVDGEEYNIDNEFDRDSLQTSNSLEITSYFDFDNAEFQRLMEVEVQVVVESQQCNIDHGEKEFDIDSVLDNTLENLV
jgi:hypothetical protein